MRKKDVFASAQTGEEMMLLKKLSYTGNKYTGDALQERSYNEEVVAHEVRNRHIPHVNAILSNGDRCKSLVNDVALDYGHHTVNDSSIVPAGPNQALRNGSCNSSCCLTPLAGSGAGGALKQ